MVHDLWLKLYIALSPRELEAAARDKVDMGEEAPDASDHRSYRQVLAAACARGSWCASRRLEAEHCGAVLPAPVTCIRYV